VLRNAEGFEVASGMALRSPDAVLRHAVAKDGMYRVSIRDLSFRGGNEFVYRATVGAIPWVSSVFPPGGASGSSRAVRWRGVNLGNPNAVTLTVPSATDEPFAAIRPVFASGTANPIVVGHSELPEALEVEPNSTRERAQPVSPPVVVSGILDPAPGRPMDEDWFVFEASAGEPFVVSLQAVLLGSKLDPVLTIYDEKGGILATSPVTDGVRDPTLSWTAPAKGRYRVRVTDLNQAGGPDAVYRLRISAPIPDYRLEAFPDVPSVPPGGRVPVTVTVERLEGFAGPVDLEWLDLPPGVRATGAMRIPANANQTVVVLEAEGSAAQTPNRGWVRARGRSDRTARGLSETYAKANDQIVRTATRQPIPMVAVGAKPEIVLETDVVEWTARPGASIEIPIRIARAANYAAKVPLGLSGAPAGVSGTGEIAQGAVEGRLVLKVEANAQEGDFTLAVLGRVPVDELRWLEHASRALTLRIRR